MILLSIITGTYNRLPHLQNMIASARRNIPTGVFYEFVLVDGGSDDGTLEWCAEQRDVRVIAGDLSGAIKAFNTGAYAATGKYVLLANDDITFHDHSILRAILHLETHPQCGAVAFMDNRHLEQKGGKHDIEYAWANTSNPAVHALPYAQVGLFRKWLGDKLNWWGYGEIDARTYGGDNLLSARVWEAGYTIQKVEGCAIDDHILRDELRELNEVADGGYFKLYPQGFTPAPAPVYENPDKEQLRVLYLPIFEDHAAQRAQKRGLREALARRFIVWEIDYLNVPDPVAEVKHALAMLKPQLVISQFHGPDARNNELIRTIRTCSPNAMLVNWNGDMWRHGSVTNDAIEMLRWVDLHLVVNASILPILHERGIPAAYWQNAIEPVDESDLPDVPAWDVVLLGNNNHAHEMREHVEAMLERLAAEHGITYGLYGDGWRTSQGKCLYDFRMGRALYKKATLTISDAYPDEHGFVSNRLYEALASKHCVVLQQHVPLLAELNQITPGEHYFEWRDLEELEKLILQVVKHPPTMKTDDIFEKHSFDARVDQLFEHIKNHAKRGIGGVVKLINTNPRAGGGIVGQVTGQQYTYESGAILVIDSRDAELLLKGSGSWQRV